MGITVLQFHYFFFMMLSDLHDGMCVLGSRDHIPYFRMKLYTQMALRLRPLPLLYFGGKERRTCLEHSILNIVCCNLMCNFFSLLNSVYSYFPLLTGDPFWIIYGLGGHNQPCS